MNRFLVLLAGCLCAEPFNVQSQTVTAYPTTRDNVPQSEVTINAGGGVPRRPRNYDYYNFIERNRGFALSPYVFTIPQPVVPKVAGPTIPYSPLEYTKIVEQQLNASPIQPSGARLITRSIVQETTAPGEAGRYRLAETHIVSVGDRGTLIIDTREEVRLRGVAIPSERSTEDITRLYAREAMRNLSTMTADQALYVSFEDPLRGQDGVLLGTFYLRDGTNLNRVMLESGLGRLVETDFLPDQEIQDLAEAQESARSGKIGVWSH